MQKVLPVPSSDAEVQSDLKHFHFKVFSKQGRGYPMSEEREKKLYVFLLLHIFFFFFFISSHLKKKSLRWSSSRKLRKLTSDQPLKQLCRHCPSRFLRLSKAGHEGFRNDLRIECSPDHQRAHGCCDRLRSRQESFWRT